MDSKTATPMLAKRSECCGCWACFNACPRKCIAMVPDKAGFLYPSIDMECCSGCSACTRACPVVVVGAEKKYSLLQRAEAYAAWNLDEDVRIRSSSGGVFSLLASYVLREGGVVFGARMANDLSVLHVPACNDSELNALRGSKYLQSNILTSYQDVKSELAKGRLVLFSGTPCQVAGLRCFLGEEFVNLLTCDLVCHGVPSKVMFNAYIDVLEHRYRARVQSVFFRDKRAGWTDYFVVAKFDEGKEYSAVFRDDFFMRAFLSDLCLRESCYTCGFKACGDVTLGDFWGIDRLAPDIFDDRGVSLLLANTEKGDGLLRNIRGRVFIKEVPLEIATKYNPCVLTPVTRPARRDEFIEDVDRMAMHRLLRKYGLLRKTRLEQLVIRVRKEGYLVLGKLKRHLANILDG